MDERRAETRRKQRKQQRYRRLTYLTVLALLLAGCGVWFAARAGWGPVPPPDSSGDTSQGGASSEDGTGSQGAASSGSSPADSSQDSNPPEEKTDQPAWFVPESQAVDAGWYDDAVFLGDSRLDGFRLYAGPSGATYFTEAGAKALSIQEKNTERLADGSKVGKEGFCTICDLSNIDALITDKTADPEHLEAIREQGVEINVL